ncbi:MAG: transglycosylase SLT domain-containing protein [Rhodocyclaceae bacterium]
MSASMTVKAPPVRRFNAVTSLFFLGLLIAGLFLALHFFTPPARQLPASEALPATAGVSDKAVEARPVGKTADAGEILTQPMRGALDYVTRRYHVSQDALLPIFAAAQVTAREHGLDPLLIVAVIGIESGFNPLAQSTMGALGLMQVMPRYHRDKVPQGAGNSHFLDPVINVQVGAQVLREAIHRNGGLVAGLQQYGGSPLSEGGYADKVLAEKRRLEQVAQRSAVAGV